MTSFEINKIMGSVFSIILFLLIIKNLSNILYPIQEVTHHHNNEDIEVTNLVIEIINDESRDILKVLRQDKLLLE